MSEPTLYRWATDEEERTNRHTSPESWVRLYDDLGEFGGLLVPVEPCEHGNIGEHVIRDQKRTYHPSELCPGAGIGGDDE